MIGSGVRRRGRDVGLRGPLVERELELDRLRRALERARLARGSVTQIEAPAGKGKSRLLTIAGDLAREADMRVIGGAGSELERDFPFGVAIQLFEPCFTAADPHTRRRLEAGPARHAGELLAGHLPGTGPARNEHVYATIHGLYWLLVNLTSEPAAGPPEPPIEPGERPAAGAFTPVAILVDDLHWVDRPSLRFLAYLAERIAELPVALVVALRAGDACLEPEALAAIRRAAGPLPLRPESLSAAGVAELVAATFPEADEAFCAACRQVTNGNPFLLTELLAQLRADGRRPDRETATRLAEQAPQSVMNAVLTRLASLPPAARSVARAVATLGAGADLRHVARLAEVPVSEAAAAADLLSSMHLFHPGSPMSFVHPLIATAVRDSIPPLDRGSLHRRAARILLAAGAPEELVAAQLMEATPDGDAGAAAALRAAAARALASDAPDSAARLLERALAEGGCHPAEQAELVAELAEAELAAGLASAVTRLEQARLSTTDPRLRARLALAHGRTLYEQGDFERAAMILAGALDELGAGEPELADELAGAYVAAAFFVPRLRPDAQRRAEGLVARLRESPSRIALDVLAHLAVHGGLRAERRERVQAVARAAWAEGALLSVRNVDGLSWPLAAAALLYVGALEEAVEICDAALARARKENSPAAFAAASCCRAWPLYEQGRIAEAAADSQAALDAQPDGWQTYVRGAYAALACCYVELGQLDRAETALAGVEQLEGLDSVHLPSLLDARAHLRLAQHRAQEALADAVRAGELLGGRLGVSSPGPVPWRSTAALAQLALGQPHRARELAGEELEQALSIGIPRLISRNLRILGLAEGGQPGLELLGEAVERAEGQPTRLEHIHALLAYGAALRRANRRTAAREPLRLGLELAHRGGATVLAERIATELAASGARRKRVMLSGLQSLTPSERRVAEVATQGLTTRQIAETLFVTPKTVEFHLRHIYQKLAVSSREQLSQAIAREYDR